MNIFTTKEFISEVQKLLKNKAHANCEKDIIESIFKKTIDEIKSIGTKRLGGHPEKNPFIRKRIGSEKTGKSSGYRLYFWLFIIEENVYLMFIHPKTGRRSTTNISSEKQKELVKTFKHCKEHNLFFEVELGKTRNKIVYTTSKKSVFK